MTLGWCADPCPIQHLGRAKTTDRVTRRRMGEVSSSMGLTIIICTLKLQSNDKVQTSPVKVRGKMSHLDG